MDRDDAAARISRQADDDTRRAACDVIIDNSGPVEETKAAVGRLIETRIRPFAANLASGRRAPRTVLDLVDPADADWAGDAQRVVAKLRHGTSDEFTVEHIGSTSVPGLPAKDVIDLQLLVPDLTAAGELAPRLAELGYPGTEMSDHLGEQSAEGKWFHANTDPGRAVNLHVRTADSVGVRFARAFRDLLIADAGERNRYLELKRARLAEAKAAGKTSGQMIRTYAESKEPYFLQMRRRLVPDSFD
jgi:dephospho-CoA kinase